jgi:hypothetical protein
MVRKLKLVLYPSLVLAVFLVGLCRASWGQGDADLSARLGALSYYLGPRRDAVSERPDLRREERGPLGSLQRVGEGQYH